MRITNPALIQVLIKALADSNSSNILALTASRPLSVMDIVERTNIPISSAYRRISQLEEQGLIGVDRTIVTPEGKSYNKYKASFSQVTVKFQDGEFLVEVIPNKKIVDRAARLFFSFDRRKD
ncbi:MAG: winged helix-turn-helix transcriptional regulator [Candidatus Heimdallarchaeota archaeon]|nr:MAG: winged helix-turn-helix transcriptional regulator [Candidatus Heimdallarchaeota archaeon]